MLRPCGAASRVRTGLTLFCVGMFTVIAGCTPSDESQSGQPNLLLVFVDTLRADHPGAYGYLRETSPAIDAFARTAIRFGPRAPL